MNYGNEYKLEDIHNKKEYIDTCYSNIFYFFILYLHYNIGRKGHNVKTLYISKYGLKIDY